MPTSYVDRYGRAASICHALPARLKILIAFAFVIAGVSIPVEFWPAQGVLAVLIFVGHSLARIPMLYLSRRVALFLPLALMFSISVPLSQGFAAGWEIMAAILFRSTLAFLAMLWLVNVLPFSQLLATLRRLWVPEVILAMLAFMYRYVYLLWDELEKMRTARRARSFGRVGMFRRFSTTIQLVGMLLIRAMGRAERVYGAMCARGWDGRVRTLDDP